jgi:hypothetical protein
VSDSLRQLRDVPGASADLAEFQEQRIWQGGDVGSNVVNLMHPSRVPGGKVIVQGVSLGGFEEARSCVRDGTLDPSEGAPPFSSFFFSLSLTFMKSGSSQSPADGGRDSLRARCVTPSLTWHS